jgi:hypothetical protein
MRYLVCDRCNGYYELLEGESKQDFLRCSCGGNLSYMEEVDIEYQDEDWPNNLEYLENEKESYKNVPNRVSGNGGNRFYLFIVVFFLILLFASATFQKTFIFSNNSSAIKSTVIGSNSYGYVDKYVYNGSSPINADNKKIAIITGIHPREKLSKSVWTDLIKNYKIPHGWIIVQYDINVVENPSDFSVGRSNGESLASSYVLPDIRKSQYDLIIVCHDHEPGYGDGFFFATPRMDSKSVSFADSLKQKLSNFNYYKNNNNATEGTSNIHFTNYLVSDGYRTIVYEMPGLSTYAYAYNMTDTLLNNSIQTL